jgi:hypothetical protein
VLSCKLHYLPTILRRLTDFQLPNHLQEPSKALQLAAKDFLTGEIGQSQLNAVQIVFDNAKASNTRENTLIRKEARDSPKAFLNRLLPGKPDLGLKLAVEDLGTLLKAQHEELKVQHVEKMVSF